MNTEIQSLFEKVYQGNSLTRHESAEVFSAIIKGDIDDISLAGLLTALKVKGETVEEICGAADASIATAKPFPYEASEELVDLVGTGGDGYNTINISTTAAFVAAAAGAKVAKHGSRSVSSKSGSSDLLSHLGIDITMSPESASKSLKDNHICFLFAPHYHGGFKHAVPVRQALKTRTIFNILGPLINPSRPDYMLLGVYSPELIDPIATVLNSMGVKRAMVVHGSGLDEVAVHGITQVTEINNGEFNRYQLTPKDFGITTAYSIDELTGRTPEDNAAITSAILQGKGQSSHTHAVAVNAACALYISGKADNIQQAMQLTLDTINSGTPFQKLTQLASASCGGDSK
ncbi:anthranilate phosphoribosyltransferase [Parashewanella spongiae]|uniref:Anthranilate phosphoribosyltransferase n=1 Tax=Parashewanella spongiae TaxID=342950 RepID=A0A3A6UJV4_9GAMM|nr:anthranilate phosphoribosyltransferase [Parashewanella spongiae]MCL1076740.1 anthranilate phosphoribosyltransferase [Parashewanella spongiae]RJY19481.1 anthranilate phosphoribosyltransferase [Parashewanella spongiae]